MTQLIYFQICFFQQNLSTDGQTTEVRAAIHVASAGGKEYLRTLEELLKAPDVSINIVNNYGRFDSPMVFCFIKHSDRMVFDDN